MTEELGFLEEGTLGFEPIEVEGVIANYVCAVCHSSLLFFHVPNERVVIIVCPEHGNIEKVGRVMKSTVSIETERSILEYKEAVRNLKDLWPELQVEGFEYLEAVRIRKHYVCKKCGGFLVMQYKSMKSQLIDLNCSQCGSNIEQDGYVKKGEYSHVTNSRTH